MAGKRAHQKHGRVRVHKEGGIYMVGTPEPSQTRVPSAQQEGARIQQTSPEALPLSPVLLGLASEIIMFSQVPRVSFYPVTRVLIPLCR